MLLAFFSVVVLLKGKYDSIVESAMIGKAAPQMNLPSAIHGEKGFSIQAAEKTPVIVNIFSASCQMCQIEQGILEEIGRAENIPVYGISYKDDPEKLMAWLDKYGDPYEGIGADADGHAAADWGVSSVPATFIVDANGVIRYKQAGVVTDEAYQSVFKPLLASLKK